MRVFIYFNLRKKCYSIKALEGDHKGRVIGHAKRVILNDCTFKVSEAGRQRVLRTKRKNVHAGVVGHLYGPDAFVPYDQDVASALILKTILADVAAECVKVTYNPYKYTSFVSAADDRLQVQTAAKCYLNEDGVFAKTVRYYVPAFDVTKRPTDSDFYRKAPDNKHRVRAKQLMENV